jgi:hypothetical protein
MSFLIGGFSSREYAAYLNPNSGQHSGKSIHWIAHFNLANFSAIAIIINRLTYFILHRFSIYPNNNLLFNKFKSHDFTKISNIEQIKESKKVFKIFEKCSNIDRDVLKKIRETLKTVKQSLKGEKAPVSDQLKEGDISEKKVEQEDKEYADVKKAEDINTVESKAEEVKPAVGAIEDSQQDEPQKLGIDDVLEETDKDHQDKEEGEQLDLNSGKKQSSDPFFLDENVVLDLEEDEQLPGDQNGDLAKKPIVNDVSLTIKDKIIGDKEEEPTIIDKQDSLKEEVSSDDESGLSVSPSDEEEEATSSQKELEESTWLRLASLFGELEEFKQEDDLEEEEILLDVRIPLPALVEDMVRSPTFPINKSLNELFEEGKAKAKDQYRKNLQTLLHFESKLQSATQKTDPRFETYMRQADQVFFNAWLKACDQDLELHNDFNKAFPTNPPQLQANGEVVCTAAQLDWVIHTISHRFPAIYQFAFDAPSLGIYQSLQMVKLAKLILIRPDVEDEENSSPCFIRLRETEGKSTPIFENDTKDNPLVMAGSYIYTLLFGPNGKVGKDEGEVKQKFYGLTHAYVRDWLQQPGAILQFDHHVIKGGQSTEIVKSSDWVAYVRDRYTQTLLAMTREELVEEIDHLSYQCPLVRLIAKTYAPEIEDKEWKASHFPAAILEKLFEEELRSKDGTRKTRAAIRQTIDDANFKNRDDIATLAKKAGCLPHLIEPLIRIRVLYMMGCMSQNASKTTLRGINQRAEGMYDPAVCKASDEQILFCHPGEERILTFNDRFAEFNIVVQTIFTDRHKVHPIAQGASSLRIGSLNHSKKEKIDTSSVDLQDLRFSLYASKAQRRYLTAQIDPQTLVDHMERLALDVARSKLVNNGEDFQIAKEEDQKKWWWNKTFDSTRYQNFDQDIQNLNEAIRKGNVFVTCWNTQKILTDCNQLSPLQSKRFKEASVKIRRDFEQALKVLEEVYIGKEQDEQWKILTAKVVQLREMLEVESLQIKVVEIDSEEDSSASSISSDDEIDPLSSDKDSTIIGKTPKDKGILRAVFGTFYDYSAGFILNETSEVKYLRWKIERYEDLIKEGQKTFLDYIKTNQLGPIDELLHEASSDTALDWQRQLLPLLKLCTKNLQEGRERLNPEYLFAVRDVHQVDLLGGLRKAATWAKENPTMTGANHIDAICCQLYTTVDLNNRCQDVLNTFQKLGEDSLKGKEKELHPLPDDPRFDLIRDLYRTHQQIKAVPNDAKAPCIKQWANSLRGHINGFKGITAFDPNMQSNPMHVFFNQVITIKGKASEKAETFLVKDIAMGSPTIEIGDGQVEIAPEFLGWMRDYQRKGYVHVYINHQNFMPKAWVEGDESARCQALHDLADHEFKDTLIVMTLSQNSPFYEQIGHSLNSLDVKNVKDAVIAQLLDGKSKALRNVLPSHLIKEASLHQWMAKEIDRIHREEFENCPAFGDSGKRDQFVQRFHDQLREHINELLVHLPGDGKGMGYSIYDPSTSKLKTEQVEQMFDRTPQETGNCISPDLIKKHDLREWGVKAVNLIHQKMFGGRDNLSVIERRIFVRLFYQLLSRKVLLESKAKSCNKSCKDRIDRGAAADAEDYAALAILQDCMNRLFVIAFFLMLVFARAIIVRKRSIIEERLERLFETVKFMLEHQTELRELYAELFEGIDVSIDQFDSQQTALKLEDTFVGSGFLDKSIQDEIISGD